MGGNAVVLGYLDPLLASPPVRQGEEDARRLDLPLPVPFVVGDPAVRKAAGDVAEEAPLRPLLPSGPADEPPRHEQEHPEEEERHHVLLGAEKEREDPARASHLGVRVDARQQLGRTLAQKTEVHGVELRLFGGAAPAGPRPGLRGA